MFKIKQLIKKLFKKNKSIATFHPNKKVNGRVLFSYLLEPALLSENNKKFSGHSNWWESKEIINIFNKLGYIVDVINYDNKEFYPEKKYDVIFDIDSNLQRITPFLNKNTIKILHITGSYPYYSINAELKRIEQLENRKQLLYSPKRIVMYPELFEKSMRIANFCSLIGNKHTLNTFPQKYKNKITLVTVSGSKLNYIKKRKNYVSKEKEFLWFFGNGAVHKGLDLVLDVFAKNKKLVLNIISGFLEGEKDFFRIYRKELTNMPNIKYHGFLLPESKEFISVINKCFCFIAPSCSEGISPSVATCLQIGLFPIISFDTGISLPKGYGIYLNDCSIEEIEKAIIKVYNFKKNNLQEQIYNIQKIALKNYSRNKFSDKMTNFIKNATNVFN